MAESGHDASVHLIKEAVGSWTHDGGNFEFGGDHGIRRATFFEQPDKTRLALEITDIKKLNDRALADTLTGLLGNQRNKTKLTLEVNTVHEATSLRCMLDALELEQGGQTDHLAELVVRAISDARQNDLKKPAIAPTIGDALANFARRIVPALGRKSSSPDEHVDKIMRDTSAAAAEALERVHFPKHEEVEREAFLLHGSGALDFMKQLSERVNMPLVVIARFPHYKGSFLMAVSNYLESTTRRQVFELGPGGKLPLTEMSRIMGEELKRFPPGREPHDWFELGVGFKLDHDIQAARFSAEKDAPAGERPVGVDTYLAVGTGAFYDKKNQKKAGVSAGVVQVVTGQVSSEQPIESLQRTGIKMSDYEPNSRYLGIETADINEVRLAYETKDAGRRDKLLDKVKKDAIVNKISAFFPGIVGSAIEKLNSEQAGKLAGKIETIFRERFQPASGESSNQPALQ